MPYIWQEKAYTESGLYYDTLVSALGCDSIIELHLTVLPEYATEDSQSILTSQMPYTYLDTVFNDSTMSGNSTHIFNRKTEAGCDSIVTLKLNVVNDLVELQENYFERCNVYPNPVNRDGMV